MRPLLLLLILTGTVGLRASEVTTVLRYTPETLELRQTPGGVLPQVKGCEPGPVPVGAPDLPVAVVQVLVPQDWGQPVLDCQFDERVVARGVQIRPRQPAVRPGDLPPAVVAPDPIAYAGAATQPVAELVMIQRMRGQRIAMIHVHPLRYDDAEASLSLATTVTIRLSDSQPQAKALVQPQVQPLRPGDRRILDTILPTVVNPEQLTATDTSHTYGGELEEAATPPATSVDYLIVTNRALWASFGRLAARREQSHGYSTHVVTVEDIAEEYKNRGSDLQAQIRACIADHYNNNDTWMVVLGGCDQVVPDRDCYVESYSNTEKKMPTDLYYSCLDNSWDEDGDGVYGEAGSDSVDMGYEVIVGRIPVNTAEQADAYIDKLIALEDNPPSDIHDKFLMGGAGLGMAAWDGGTGYESDQNIAEADGHASLYAREGAINDDEAWSRRIFRNWVWGSGYQPATTGCFFSSLTSWDDAEPGDYPVSDTNMVTRFNENWNQVWWFTHGNYSLWSAGGGFSSSDALALTGHINIIATAACMTAGFDKADPCLSEAFLRNPDGGAVIYVGSSRYGLGDGIPNGVGGPSGQYGGYFFRSMLGSSTRLAGPAFAAHKRALSSYCGSNGPYRWLQFSINLQGDPAYRLRLQDTAPLQVTTPSELPTADTGAAYSTQLAATGGATPYRWTVEGGSYTEAGIAASWVAPGDAQGWQGDDDNHALDLPFAFPFYGIPYDRVIVTTNGSISFTSEAYFGGTTAGEFLSTMCIAPLWTDLATDGDADHDVYINANTERIAITWKGYLLGSSETGVHIQTVLYPDGTIDCNYKDADGISAAVGVSFGDGRTYTAGYYWGSRDDVNPILPNTSYRYTYDHNLPDGWSFSADGELSGNPTNIGKLTLTALVADDSPYPEWVRRSFTLLIDDPDNVPPTVASPASADPSVVQATTTTTLSCLGTDDGGEASLNYTWSASGGPAAVSFDTDNGTNAGKTCTATFTAAGTYTFTCTITDASLRAAHSEVVVEVQATPTTLSVTPQTAAVLTGASVAFTTTVEDQFDDTLSSQPTITWSVDSGGTIDASGVFTAGTGSDAVGSHTITASAGSLSDTATVTVLCAAPPPWIAEDIGGVGATGHTSYDSTTGTFTLTGSGADIWNDADEFHFLHRTWRGDGTVTARVASLENTHSWAKAGVMVRASTDPDSSCAMMAITPGNGATFQYRTAAGSDAASSRDDSWSAPAWVRLQRSGDTLTGSVSADGSSWTEVGTVDIPMATAVEIGLALTSHADGALAQAAFDNLSLRDERRLAIQVADGLGGLTTVVTATQGPEIHYCEEADDHDIRGLEDNADLTIDFGVPTNGG